VGKQKLQFIVILVLLTSCSSKELAYKANVPTPEEIVLKSTAASGDFPGPTPTPGRECYCAETASEGYSGANVRCVTEELPDGTKFYWQHNCGRIWMTLENMDGKKFVINEVPVSLHGYAYRLGYQFIKDFKNGLLFRSGCAGSGPCEGYYLIDRSNGKVIKRFPQLIEIDTDIRINGPSTYPHDFVVYLAPRQNRIIAYFVEDGRTYSAILAEEPDGAIPERQFSDLRNEEGTIKLNYVGNNGAETQIIIHVNR
jgi:hypothetical protein